MEPMKVVDWPAVRIAYERSAESVTAIAGRFAVSRQSIARRAEEEGWSRNGVTGPAEDIPSMVEALQRTTARLVAAMEVKVGTAGEGVDERDVRALGALAGTLAKLNAIDLDARSDHDGQFRDTRPVPSGAPGDGLDEDAAVDEIVALAERFVQSRRTGGLPSPAAPGDADLPEALLADGRAFGPAPAAG